MKAILLSGLVAFVAYGVTIGYASEPRHAVIVDTPEIITMTYASPNTWHTLPPVQLNEQLPATIPGFDPIDVPNSIWRPVYLAANQQ
jgi:hypothetical protein